MKIEFDSKVKAHLEKKNKDSIMVDYNVEGCWVKVPVPYVSMEYPKNEEHYVKHEVDGIKVFVKKGIKAKKDKLTIKLSGFAIFKTMEVFGMDIKY